MNAFQIKIIAADKLSTNVPYRTKKKKIHVLCTKLAGFFFFFWVLWATSVDRGELKVLHGEFRESGAVNI